MTLPFPTSGVTAGRTRKAWSVLVNMLLGSLVAAADNNTDTLTFDWYSLEPSDELHWTACGGGFKCARLNLPLDYSASNDTNKTAIALRMLPAKDQKNYKGTILINPGGPGASGTMFAATNGVNMSQVVGDSFDILGFDPRGVGASTPLADCFNNNDAERQQWSYGSDGRLLNLTDGSLPIVVGRENLTALRCEGAIGGPDGIGRFMSTASVARDMLEITQRLGQEKLQYWGFSYGTILGQYFAAMFPDKVGRLVIDGIYDGDNYRAALWNSNLVDTEKVLDSFFQFCFKGGPSKCPLYSPSPEQIKARFFAVLDKLERQPISLVGGAGGPALITSVELRSFMFEFMYSPLAGFPAVALTVAAIERDDTTTLAAVAAALQGPPKDACAAPSPPWLAGSEAQNAIQCGDADLLTYSPDDFAAYYRDLTALSPFAAPLWGQYRLDCALWPTRAPGRYTGALAANGTAHPLLLVSPAFDPVCPLADARKVRERFGGAGLLVQNSYGHCSLAAPSLCTARYVREYFVNGTIPKEGTVCEVDELPFVGQPEGAKAKRSAEETDVLNAIKAMGQHVGAPRRFRHVL